MCIAVRVTCVFQTHLRAANTTQTSCTHVHLPVNCNLQLPTQTAGQLDTEPSPPAAAFRDVWSAAVSAATDLQLSATPAFGGRRPDVPWLVQTLPVLLQQLATDRLQRLGSNQLLQCCAGDLLQPLLAAAVKLLTDGSNQGTQAAAQLLDGICAALAPVQRAGQVSYTGVVQPTLKQVMDLLQQYPELPQLQHLQAGLSTALNIGLATAGDVSLLTTAEQLSAGIDVSELHWAAARGAAGAARTPESNDQLLKYWFLAVSAEQKVPSCQVAACCDAVAKVLAAGTAADLGQKLLSVELPMHVLGALLQAGLPAGQPQAASPTMQLLLGRALQHKQLSELPATVLQQLLTASLTAAATPAAKLQFGDCLRLLQLLLTQDASDDWAAAADMFVANISGDPASTQQFQQVILQHSASRSAAKLLLCMVACACRNGDTELSWSLFGLSQQLDSASGGGAPAELPSQQAADAFGSLLELQSQATAAGAMGRVLKVWQHMSAVGFTVQQLSPAAQQVALSALVSAQQHEQALRLVNQAPQLLLHLVQLWQGRQPPPDAQQLLVPALEACVAADSQQGASAAAIAVSTHLLRQGAADVLGQHGTLLVQLVKLLCAHSRHELAAQLLPVCEGEHGQGASAAAVEAYAVVAVATAETASSQARQQLVLVLAEDERRQLVLAALSLCLTQAAPAAAALLL
jgi:hypothetical protein